MSTRFSLEAGAFRVLFDLTVFDLGYLLRSVVASSLRPSILLATAP